MRVLDSLAQQFDLENVRAEPDREIYDQYLYSRGRAYRYAFARSWAGTEPSGVLLWVMLNPASRDPAKKRRYSLSRVVKRSLEIGADGILICNLFAYCAQQPSELDNVQDPI